MTPIWVPPLTDPSWARAKIIVDEFRAEGCENPMIVAGVVNSLAEAAWKAVVSGDHGQSFGPWQMKWAFYGQPILDALGVDIRTEADLAKQTRAVLFALKMKANLPTYVALRAAVAGGAATQIWARDFERASAGGAVERRVAIAGPIEVGVAHLLAA